MSTSKYKGKDDVTAGSEYVSMGGRDGEGGKIAYTNLYLHNLLLLRKVVLPMPAQAEKTRIVNGVKYTVYLRMVRLQITQRQTLILRQLLEEHWVEEMLSRGQLRYAASEGLLQGTPDTNMLTAQIEDVQAKINTARVQAGSQYAAIESAIGYTTDLTAQYELGFNTVNDVNFSMETAHLAKNQILQQAATAMLAQANQGQQGLLQLIQI